jgi:hypothetical protein
MRLAVGALALGLLGCTRSTTDFPVDPNGGGGHGGGGGGTGGSGEDAASDGGPLAARVCLVSDLRTPTIGCATTGADNLTVTLDGATATTFADGSFTIANPISSTPVWHVTGATIETSVVTFSTARILPAVRTNTYLQMIGTNGVAIDDTEGSIIAMVIAANGSPFVNATAVATPPSVQNNVIFYDDADPITWGQAATSTSGVVWAPALAAGSSTLAVTGTPSGSASVPNIPVEAKAITYVTALVH